MKIKSKSQLMLMLLALFLIISIIPYNNLNEYKSETDEIIDNNTNRENKKIKPSDSFVLSGININGNGEWASTASVEQWCSGSGNWTHPYVIENVTIDGQGSGSCITIQNSDVYFIIRNCTVYNSGELWENNAGVRLNNVKNGTLSNINSSHNNMYGVYMTNCVNNSLVGINTSNNAFYGIYLKQSHNNTIKNCIVNNHYEYIPGIQIRESNNTFLLGNTIKHFLGTGIYYWDSHNSTIVGNTFTNISGSAISISGVNHNISANIMKGCGLYVHYESFLQMASIKIDKTNKVNGRTVYYYLNKTNLRSSNFTNAGQVILAHCNNTLIKGQNTSQSTFGFTLFYCINNTLLNNNVSSCSGMSFKIQYGENNTISGNVINNNEEEGMRVMNEKNCNISDNTLYNNGEAGIQIDDCNIVNLSRNLMKGCGLELYGSSTEMASYDIGTTNKVNGRPVYYYVNQNGLEINNFTNAGQVSLYRCNYSSISNENVSFSNMGIIMRECSHNLISTINASFNTEYGIYIRDCENITISDCNLNSNRAGIRINNINNCLIEGNSLISNNYGIDAHGIQQSHFVGNIITNSQYDGISIFSNCLYSNFTGNVIQNNNGFGFIVGQTYFCNITRNLIDNNGEDGINLNFMCDNNTVSLNNITNNNHIGLIVGSGSDNYIFGNEFIGNIFHAADYGTNNYWNNSYIGNFWDNYTGNDNNNDGIGEDSFSIAGGANSEDYKPLKITIWDDFDSDGLTNIEEFLNGNDNYITNATNPDTDDDGMPDGWESVNLLNPTTDDALGDAEGDLLLNIYEYQNGTDPQSSDSDGDTSKDPLFDDYYEVNAGTDPTNKWWYPMPNLRVLDFTTTNAKQGESFVLNFTIINDGIHDITGIIIIIRVDDLNKVLYDNTDSPINIDVDETYNGIVTSSDIDEVGKWSITLTIDPSDLINETYSQKDGSFRPNSNNDNIKQTVIEISKGEEVAGIDPISITIIIIVVSAAVGVSITGLVLVRRSKQKLKATQRELESHQQQRTEITEDDIVLSKEQHFCLVHKGPIEGYNFICPQCGAYYCAKCIEAIKKIENACWSCQKPLDPSKPIKEVKEKDELKPIMEDIIEGTEDAPDKKRVLPKKAPKSHK